MTGFDAETRAGARAPRIRAAARPAPLFIASAQRVALSEWVAGGYPNETCGLMVGVETPAGTFVERVEQGRNVERERSRDRFTLSPEDHLAIEIAARGDGLEVVGVWHSHPDQPARPSHTDLAAAWEGYSYLIFRVTRTGVREATSWRLAGAEFVEQAIVAQRGSR